MRLTPGDNPRSYPWFKFYPSNWQGDELLQLCSFGARGLLIELLCLMHKAQPYGHLLVNGRAPSDVELARLLRASSVEELQTVRGELLTAGVLSRMADGTIYSRRMVRQAEQTEKGRANGRKGGNPKLTGVNPGGYGEGLTPGVKTQRIEDRGQRDRDAWKLPGLHVSRTLHRLIVESLGKRANGVNWDQVYETAAAHYLEHGSPADQIGDLKVRARRAAALVHDRDSIPSAEETRRRVEAEQAEAATPAERAEAAAKLRAMFAGSR
jgi:hypothetical protein